MPAPTSGQRRLTVVLTADVSKFVGGLATAQKALQSASRSMIAVGQNLAFGIGAPLAAISTRLIKMSGDFEKSGNAIVTQTQLTRAEVNKLKVDVTKLSESLTVTASKAELLKGGLAVAGAGFSDASQVSEVLTKSAQLASLGLGDIDTVSRALTATLTSFAPQGVNAAEAANAFLLAVQEGGFPAEQFAGVVTRLGSVATLAGVSLQELIAVLAVYTRSTGDADEATTGLTRILTDIAAPSDKAKKAWLDIFPGEGILKVRRLISEDMPGFLVTLAQRMKELPIEIFQEIAVTLFDNERAMRAFVVAFGSQGPAVVETLKRIVTNTLALPKALNEVRDSWAFAFDTMVNEIDNLTTAAGDKLLPTMKNVAKEIGGWAFAVVPLVTANAKLLFTISAITVGAIALLVIIGQVGLGISALMGVATTLGTALVGIGSAISGVIGWFGALATSGSIFGVVVASSILTIVVALAAVLAAQKLYSNESTKIALGSSSNWVKAYAVGIEIIKFMFTGLGLFLNSQLRSTLEDLKKPWTAYREWLEEHGLQPKGKGPLLFESLFDKAIASTESGTARLRKELDRGAKDTEKLVFQMVSGLKPLTDLPDLKLPDIIVPGAEIDKLREAGLFASSLKGNLEALANLPPIQVFEVKTGKLREATLGELQAIQAEASTLEPVDVGVFSVEDAMERLGLFRSRFEAVIPMVAGFRSQFDNLLKNLGIKMGEFRMPIDEAAAKKVTDALAKIRDKFLETQDALAQLRHGWTDFEVETIKGVRELEKIGAEAGFTKDQIKGLTIAWELLRKQLDKETQAVEAMKEVSDAIHEARVELTALESGMTELEQATAAGMDKLSSIDLSVLTEGQRKAVEKARLNYLDLRIAIERENKKIKLDIEETFFSAFDSILRGVLEGTQTWEDVLNSFADIGTGIFLDLFKQFIKSKVDFDKLVIPNFLKTIPDALQTSVDKMQEMNEVFAAISDQDLADLIAGAEPAGGELPLPVPVGSDFKGAGTQEVEGVKDGITGFFDEIGAWFTKGWNNLTGQVEEVELPVVKPPKVEPPEIDIAAMTPDPIYLDPIEVKPPTVDVAPLATVKLAAPKVEVPPLPPVKVPVTAVADPEGTIVVNVPVQIAPPDALMVDVPLVMRPIEEIPVTVPIQVQEPDIQTVHVGIDIPPLEPIVLDLPTVEMAPMDPLRVDVPVVPNPVETLYVDVPVEYKQIHPLFLDIPIEPPKIAPITVDVPVFANPIEPLRVDVPIQPRDVPPIDVPLVLAPIEPLVVEVPILLAPVEPVIPMAPMEEFDRTAASGIGGLAGLTQGVSELNAATVQTSDSIPLVSEGLFSFLDTFGGFGTAIQEAGSAVGSFFTDLFDPEQLKAIGAKVSGWFGGVFDGLLEGIKTFSSEAVGAIGGIISAISMLASGGGKGKHAKAIRIIGIVGSIAGALASVAGGISAIGSGIAEIGVGLSGGPQTSVSSQPVGTYQHGGIAKRPTLGVFGEKGPEALVPLSKMADYMASPETTVIVNSPHPATVRKTDNPDEKLIEVIIDDVISRSFRTGGKASQALERNFGVRRVGGTR